MKKAKKINCCFHLDSNRYKLGDLLIAGYLSKDTIASWCCSIVLTHLINENLKMQKEMIQVIIPADQSGTSDITLMEISINILQNVNQRIFFLL